MKILTRIELFSAIAFTGVLLAFSGCKTEEKADVALDQQEYPRSETLYIGGFDWAPPATFNPLVYDPNFPIVGNVWLMYETLVTYNQPWNPCWPTVSSKPTTPLSFTLTEMPNGTTVSRSP